MNREIKFRAWNQEMNHMVFPSLEFGREIWPCTYKQVIKSQTNENGDTEEIVLEMVSVDHILQSPEFIVMQFTGLKDKNGNEIYEGDIVSHLHSPYSCVVLFEQQNAMFLAEEIDGEKLGYEIEHVTKVIGNIFENPLNK
jgi:uncharacterized phage protein (TIGR01671 family)